MAETTDPVRVGLIGLGNSGWFYHAEASIEPSDTCQLIAVCAEDGARVEAAEERFGVPGTTDWQELLRWPDVEVVVLALPHHLHHPVTVAALEAGKHVVVEKPMAVSTSEADEMIATAERTGQLLSVFQQRRYEPDFQVIRDAVADGRIGRLWSVRKVQSHQGRYHTAAPDAPHVGGEVLAWAHDRASGGGVGFVIGPHSADHVLQLVPQRLREVSGRTHVWPGEDVEHYLDIRLAFDEDVLGQIEIFRRTGLAPTKWAVYGTEGTIVSPDGKSVLIHASDGTTEQVDDLPPVRGCIPFYDQLARAVREGGEPPVTAQQGRDATRLIELGLRSAEAGGQALTF